MKTFLSCTILALGLWFSAFANRAPAGHDAAPTAISAPAVEHAQSAASAIEEFQTLGDAASMQEVEEGVLQRLPWFAMFCAWVSGNMLALAGLWVAWRFFRRGSPSSSLSLA